MLREKLILITGGTSGIGKQIAIDLLKSNNRIIIIGLKDDKIPKTIKELTLISDKIEGIACDVANTYEVNSMSRKVLKKYGCPDVIINNAGYAVYETFDQSNLAEIERLVNVNFLGAVRCTKAFLPAMIKKGGGNIVNIASIAGRIVMTPNGMYSASKHALVAWSETLKYELARFNIKIHVICPGRVQTSFFDHKSFRRRSAGSETKLTIKIEDVSSATIKAISGNQFLTYIPWTFGLIVWVINTIPFIVKPIYTLLMDSRINSINKVK